jgi:DNA-binding MarR family transcriptional regulator
MKPIATRHMAEAEGQGRERPLILDAFLPYRLSVLANRASAALARLYADRFGIGIPEWRAMAVLGMGEPLSAGRVAERTAMDKVQVSRALAALSAKGLVERATDAADRRRAVLRLSAAGAHVYGEIVPLARDYERRLLEGLTAEERRQLDRLMAGLRP